ncbi:MAG: thiol oxidoreductase [Flavobacteriaceae bacterium]|nr:thiol oxidoreductase [Flavobacteriaceae bacterium]
MKNSLLFTLLLLGLFSCVKDDINDTSTSIPDKEARTYAGGKTTIFANTSFSFDNPAPNLSSDNLAMHLAGDMQFEQAFVTAPAAVNPGLGAQFNNTSCISCHPKDGRARFPQDINSNSGFFLRTSIPGTDIHGGPNPTPGFGGQLQNHAIYGKTPEVKFTISYQDLPVHFKDGTTIILQKPIYGITDSYIPMPAQAMFSPRIGPPVYGLGLLEAIKASDLLKNEDVLDENEDEISGKANRVWDPVSKTHQIGRFGWKGGAPSVMVQSAGAYHGDMGLTSPLFPHEADAGQTNGSPLALSTPEISQEILDQIEIYCQTLAVPAARNLDDPMVIQGFQIFEDANCVACHIPKHITGIIQGVPAISNQTIYPYTDLLLHDMGDDLADNRPEFLANGNEWQTRPLWGIGLTNLVNGHTNFLHDGRARNLEEAILWHGGEAKKSKEYYTDLTKKERTSLLAFLNAI